ncbi:MAG: hypothetical protein QM296_01745 [Bacillota bacterium]|nr:hypothetical protein [Bacillota bacterium]
MKQENGIEEMEAAIANIVALLQRPLLHGSLSEYRKRRLNRDGSTKETQPYLVVSYGSETGTKSRHVPHGRESEYRERQQNTKELLAALQAYIRMVSQRCDEESSRDAEKQRGTEA